MTFTTAFNVSYKWSIERTECKSSKGLTDLDNLSGLIDSDLVQLTVPSGLAVLYTNRRTVPWVRIVWLSCKLLPYSYLTVGWLFYVTLPYSHRTVSWLFYITLPYSHRTVGWLFYKTLPYSQRTVGFISDPLVKR